MTGALAFDDEDGEAVRVRVPAKINLHLGVGDPRGDGFHELTTVYQAISLYDEISIADADTSGVHVEVYGADADAVPRDDTNLAVRAVRLLASHFGVKPAVTLRIDKHIPMAAGLAGGSADGGAALLAAAQLWQQPVSRDDLLALAAQLGSDVPFCLEGGVALGTGHGERIEEVSTLGRYHWVAAISDARISTPQAYAEVDRLRAAGQGSYHSDVSALLAALTTGRAAALAPLLHNDMTEAALSAQPRLREVLDAGADDGALATLVSGSGPTVLFLARDDHHAHALAGRLRMRRLVRAVHTAYGPVPGAHFLLDRQWPRHALTASMCRISSLV